MSFVANNQNCSNSASDKGFEERFVNGKRIVRLPSIDRTKGFWQELIDKNKKSLAEGREVRMILKTNGYDGIEHEEVSLCLSQKNHGYSALQEYDENDSSNAVEIEARLEMSSSGGKFIQPSVVEGEEAFVLGTSADYDEEDWIDVSPSESNEEANVEKFIYWAYRNFHNLVQYL